MKLTREDGSNSHPLTHIRNKDTPWKHRYHILKFYWIHSGKRGRRTCTEYAVEKKSAFLTWKKQTYPFTRWKQHQSSSHFLHKTGIEGRKSNFSTVMLFFKKQHTRTQNIQYIKKVNFTYRLIKFAYASFISEPFSLPEKHSLLLTVTVSSISKGFFALLLQPSKTNWCCSWGTTHIKQNKIITFHHYRLKSCNSYLFWNHIANNSVSNSLAFSAGMIPDLLLIVFL